MCRLTFLCGDGGLADQMWNVVHQVTFSQRKYPQKGENLLGFTGSAYKNSLLGPELAHRKAAKSAWVFLLMEGVTSHYHSAGAPGGLIREDL